MPIPKPRWPYSSETILYANGNGQWSKKHKGKTYNFGVWSNPRAALDRWRAEWPRIVSGNAVTIVRPAASGSLQEACRSFLTARKAEHMRGDLEWSSFRDYRTACRRIIRVIGADKPVGFVCPADFAMLMEDMATITPISRMNQITKIRAAFKWIGQHHGITFEYGQDFKAPPRKAIRRQLNNRDQNILTPAQVHDMIAVANPQMKAIIMLGINGGYGNSDVAALPRKVIDLDHAIIDYYRNKTEARRVVPLWPETITALRPVLNHDHDLAFPDAKGRPLVRRGHHGICLLMEDIREASGVAATFYWFRYTFATVAANVPDDHARKLIMGHVIDGVSEQYIRSFPAARLRTLTDYVHSWLYTNTSGSE